LTFELGLFPFVPIVALTALIPSSFWISVETWWINRRRKRGFYKTKVFSTPFGVESDLFVPKSMPGDHSYVFGWVGNHNRPVKRFEQIKEVFGQLGSKYKLKIATAESNLSRKEMVDFYNSIGTLICFSASEGTPNPVLEAASCGRGLISTPVGNAPSLMIREQWFVKNKKQLKEAIVEASESPRVLNANGIRFRERIEKKWDWSIASQRFLPFLGVHK
jgi:glycosyltransferase involved in cell wall biosynthesis